MPYPYNPYDDPWARSGSAPGSEWTSGFWARTSNQPEPESPPGSAPEAPAAPPAPYTTPTYAWSSPVQNHNSAWLPAAATEDRQRWRQGLAEGEAQAWDEYVATAYNQLLPYLGVDDFARAREQLAAWDPSLAEGSYAVSLTNPEGQWTRSADRANFTADRWSALQQGIEMGNSIFAETEDPDSAAYDPLEDAQRYLQRVVELGQEYAIEDPTREMSRYATQDRAKAWMDLNSAYGHIDPRVLELGNMLYNPTQRTAPTSPRAFMGGRYSWEPRGSDAYSADWAYQNAAWR